MSQVNHSSGLIAARSAYIESSQPGPAVLIVQNQLTSGKCKHIGV